MSIIFTVLVLLICYLLLAFLITKFWNRTITKIFGLPEINFWQSLDLLPLSVILSGSNRL
jgi:hypothetical protein